MRARIVPMENAGSLEKAIQAQLDWGGLLPADRALSWITAHATISALSPPVFRVVAPSDKADPDL